jgi:hypothetical protein
MRPPAGRLCIGDRVEVPQAGRGRVVGERLVASNGAWFYTVTLDDGATVERADYELHRLDDHRPEDRR